LADPPGLSDTLCREKLIRLPHAAWCYQGLQIDRSADKSASAPVTFGSFNNFSKITTPMLELWAEILRLTPNSRLLIKAKALACKSANQQVRQILENAGVTFDRLELQSWRTSYEEHLVAYGKVDIALDTFPYHGTTTTCEALWMGVPVITLAGETHICRVGVSLLTSVGLPELIAGSPEQYVQLVVDLAKDASRLRRLRSELRERMLASPLMDASGFARNVESAYRRMWQSWCA
jgi:protein O-GlcNAc transferase